MSAHSSEKQLSSVRRKAEEEIGAAKREADRAKREADRAKDEMKRLRQQVKREAESSLKAKANAKKLQVKIEEMTKLLETSNERLVELSSALLGGLHVEQQGYSKADANRLTDAFAGRGHGRRRRGNQGHAPTGAGLRDVIMKSLQSARTAYQTPPNRRRAPSTRVAAHA